MQFKEFILVKQTLYQCVKHRNSLFQRQMRVFMYDKLFCYNEIQG